MPAYHSVFLEEPNQQLIGNIPLLPLRTRTRGPAPTLPPLSPQDNPLSLDPSHQSYDPCDEILSTFRANAFFRNFEIHGPADRLLIYGTLYTSSLLAQLRPSHTRRDADKALMNVALDNNFVGPCDAAFPLGAAFGGSVGDRNSQELLRSYLSQVRQEVAARLLDRLFQDGDTVSKWWLSFSKRKFMGKSL